LAAYDSAVSSSLTVRLARVEDVAQRRRAWHVESLVACIDGS
jgi:hypothetical protein